MAGDYFHRGYGSWLVATFVLVTGIAFGHGVISRDVPSERLIANLEKYIKNHPKDALGYYRLGRIHTMVLERKENVVLVFLGEAPAEGFWAKREPNAADPKNKMPIDEQEKHLSEAIRCLNKAIELDPLEAKFRLTLACALENGDSLKKDVNAWPLMPGPAARIPSPADNPDIDKYFADEFRSLPEHKENFQQLIAELRENNRWPVARDAVMNTAYTLRDKSEYKQLAEMLRQEDWKVQIEEQFFVAMCLALPTNGRAKEKPFWGGMEDWPAYEAAQNFVRIVESRKPGPSDQIRLKVAQETIKAFEDLPKPTSITPIVFSPNGRPYSELVSKERVSFDLDGSGRTQNWTWIAPETGILVWDPFRTGKVTSGRQLFGSFSWWIPYENGYQALEALDDNGDGDLSGAELNGIAVWFDRNSNGISDAGEVVSLESCGIVGIAVRDTATTDGCLSNPAGLRMSDGRTLPTYDWISRGLPIPKEKSLVTSLNR